MSEQPPWWHNTRGEWYVVMQSFLFALIAFGPGWFDSRVELPDTVRIIAAACGLALGALGLALALAGLLRLGENLSVFPHPKPDAVLVETGAYRMVRHPIYAGLIIGAAGWALLNVSLITLIYAGLLFVFFDIKSRREEEQLTRAFPEYAAYRARVHRLIPFIY